MDLVLKIASTDYRRAHRGRADRLDDLVQEGCLGLIDAARRYKPGRSPFANWAALHIHASIRRHLRAEGRRVEAGACDDGLDVLADHRAGSEPGSAAEAAAVREAVADLPDEDQHVLIRIFYQDASGSAIAAERGVTPGAISHRKSRALKKLRERLTG